MAKNQLGDRSFPVVELPFVSLDNRPLPHKGLKNFDLLKQKLSTLYSSTPNKPFSYLSNFQADPGSVVQVRASRGEAGQSEPCRALDA